MAEHMGDQAKREPCDCSACEADRARKLANANAYNRAVMGAQGKPARTEDSEAIGRAINANAAAPRFAVGR